MNEAALCRSGPLPGEALSPQTLEAVEWGFAPRPWRCRQYAPALSHSEAKIPSVFKLAVVGGQKPYEKLAQLCPP